MAISHTACVGLDTVFLHGIICTHLLCDGIHDLKKPLWYPSSSLRLHLIICRKKAGCAHAYQENANQETPHRFFQHSLTLRIVYNVINYYAISFPDHQLQVAMCCATPVYVLSALGFLIYLYIFLACFSDTKRIRGNQLTQHTFTEL